MNLDKTKSVFLNEAHYLMTSQRHLTFDYRPKLTVVPNLRMAMKMGAYSMPNEIRTHLEATGTGYFTVNSTKKYMKKERKVVLYVICS